MPKQRDEADLVLVPPSALDGVLALQDIAFAAFTPEQKPFLLYRPRAFFDAHFAAGGEMLGVVRAGTLIAQAALLHPPATMTIDMSHPATAAEMSVIQCVTVHPDWRGNGLMDRMVREWVHRAKAAGRTHALTRVIVQNHYSWSVFQQEGFDIHATCADPADGRTVHVMHKQILT